MPYCVLLWNMTRFPFVRPRCTILLYACLRAQVKSSEELEYDRNWRNLPGVFESQAKSRYTLQKQNRSVNGDIVVASWAAAPSDKLSYFTGETTTTVEGLNCTDEGDAPASKKVYQGDDPWGHVLACEQGPRLTSKSQEQREANLGKPPTTPPTIIMSRSDGKTFLVVEESSSSPSFLYSVWAVVSTNDNSIELHLEFRIAATMRLAEAVVTGVVHGEITGGACFGLLRQYSSVFPSYTDAAVRALPFGEVPDGDSIAPIEDNETIDYGLTISAETLLCFVCVMLLTSVGFVWSICLRSSIGMDVYDRDELIRAVSLHGVAPGGTPPSDIRIFVRREDTGNISVVISDTGEASSACARLFRRGRYVIEDVEPSPVASTVDQYNVGFGGVNVPVGRRTAWLEGVGTGVSRRFPGPNGDFQYPTCVALSASPVPSNAASTVSTPITSPVRRELEMRGGAGLIVNASDLFDIAYSSGDSPEETPNGMHTARYRGTASRSETLRLYSADVAIERPTLAVSQTTSASDIETPQLSNRSVGNDEVSMHNLSLESKAPIRRGRTRVRGLLDTPVFDSEDDTEECMSSSENLNEETKERSPSDERRSVEAE